MTTAWGAFDQIDSFAEENDFKEVSEDLAYHELLINEQNQDLEATLTRLQEEAAMKQSMEMAAATEVTMAADSDDQDEYKAQAKSSQVNIAVAQARQEELQRLIESFESR